MERISQWGYRFIVGLQLLITALLFVLSSTAITKYGKQYQNMAAVICSLLLAIGITLFLIWIYGKVLYTGRRISALLFIAILGMQMFFLIVVSHPMTIADPARVQNEALMMLKENHGQMSANNIYLKNYTNNHFIVVVLYYFYKILGEIGITRVWIPTIILNVFCIDVGIYLIYVSVKKIKGIAAANMTLLLCLLCPTTYLWLTSVYTNTLSFPFIMAILYLGFTVRRDPVKYILLGVLAVVGYFVRPTTIIAIIAVILYRGICFFQKGFCMNEEMANTEVGDRKVMLKKLSGAFVRCVLLFFVCALTWFSCSKLIDLHVDKSVYTEDEKFPIVHWIMMGMNEESGGGYDREDRFYTAHLDGLEAKRQGDMERLKQRLHRMGISGVCHQLVRKLIRVWAMGDDDGTAQSKYAYHYPVLYQYFLGENNTWFLFYMQAYRISMFLLMLFASVRLLICRQCDTVFLYGLTFLGAACFFLIWEAGRRYNICFNGVCLILMADGLDAAMEEMKNKKYLLDHLLEGAAEEKVRGIKRIIKMVIPIGILCILAVSFLLCTRFREISEHKKMMYFCSKMGSDSESINWKGIERADILEQTVEQGQMEWRNRWNRMRIYFANRGAKEKKAEYRLVVISMEDNEVIYHRKIAPKDINERGEFIVRVNDKKLSDTGYKLRLTHLGKRYNLIPKVCKFPLLDPYPYGALKVNGKETNWDLSMSIYNVRPKGK